MPILYYVTRGINDWNSLTSDVVTNSSLNSVKSAVDNYFMTSDLCLIVNVFNVIIISVDNFACVLLYVIEWVYMQASQPQPWMQS